MNGASEHGRDMPDSAPVAWRVNGERLAVLGWGQAVLLQLAHPLVAAGVADYSTLRISPRQRLRRFRRTLRAMLTLTYGSPEAVRKTARWIDGIHGQVHGRLQDTCGVFPAGTPYSARDPALLRWVHATLLDSTLLTYRLLIGPLSRMEQDRYCAEATWMGPILGIPVELLPADATQLAAYLDAMFSSGQIAVGPTARRLACELLNASPGLSGLLDLPLRLPYHVMTVGLLPPPLRDAYQLSWSPAYQLAFDAAVATCRRLVPLLPDAVRRWPEARRASQLGKQSAAQATDSTALSEPTTSSDRPAE